METWRTRDTEPVLTWRTRDTDPVLTPPWLAVDLHSLEEVTVQPGEKVTIETDATLVGVTSGFRPLVASARRELVLEPVRRREYSARFADDGVTEETLYVIAKNDGKAPVEVRLLERVGLLGVEKLRNQAWVLRKSRHRAGRLLVYLPVALP